MKEYLLRMDDGQLLSVYADEYSSAMDGTHIQSWRNDSDHWVAMFNWKFVKSMTLSELSGDE